LERRSAGFLDETEKALLNSGIPEYYSHIVALYDSERIYSHVIEFARLSLQFSVGSDEDSNVIQLRTEMHSRLFNAAIQTAQYDIAHSILALFKNTALQRTSLRTLVTRMCETAYSNQLTNLPFVGLQNEVDEILAQKCQTIVDVNIGTPYHKILYAWRIKRNNFRGAAAIALDRLQRLQNSGDGDKITSEDGLDTAVTRQYMSLINALSCVDPKQAWILAEEIPKSGINGAKVGKRKLVTLDEIRRAYQDELDRIAAIQNNQFALADGDEMDMDG
jgi:nuclear pore complex protein Nup160